MGSYVLRGITTALLITVLTLFVGILWGAIGLGGLSISQLLDIGFLASCLVGGYRTAKESKAWFMGGVTGACYVIVGTLLLALFLPISGLGFIQVLAEGALVGLAAGAFGAGKKQTFSSTWNGARNQDHFTPSYVGYSQDDHVNNDWDSDWEWDRDTPSTQNWINSSKNEFQEIREIRRDSVEDAVVEWPWDKESKYKSKNKNENESKNKNKNKNRNRNENKNKITAGETRQVQNDLVVWDKNEERAKPWWEQ